MNLLLMPMWLLSGSFFPASGAPPWIKALIVANPLTYGVAAFGIFSTSAVKEPRRIFLRWRYALRSASSLPW